MLNWMATKLICIELENVHSGNIELVRDEYNHSYYRMSILGPDFALLVGLQPLLWLRVRHTVGFM